MSEELFDIISQTLLWECASEKVEDPSELGEMLKDINYLDDKEEILEQITGANIVSSESFDVTDINREGSELCVTFEMPFILSAEINGQPIWRISGEAAGICTIPDSEIFDWRVYDFKRMSREELLSFSDIPKFQKMKYRVECDTYY
ncbi:MAG: hypothetical protein Q4F95_02575 [Oscillospiraceae bacterium]|nr:hypothetical protein [Oscillospiraceae bacterium]